MEPDEGDNSSEGWRKGFAAQGRREEKIIRKGTKETTNFEETRRLFRIKQFVHNPFILFFTAGIGKQSSNNHNPFKLFRP